MYHMPATGVSGIDIYRLTEKGNWKFVQIGKPFKKDENEVPVHWPPGTQGYFYSSLYNGISKLSINVPKPKKAVDSSPQSDSVISRRVFTRQQFKI